MKSFIQLLIIISLTTMALSHDKTNWEYDQKAYDYTQAHQQVYLKNLKRNSLLKQRGFFRNYISKNINTDKFSSLISTDYLKIKLEELSGARAIQLPNSEPIKIKERGSNKGKSLALTYLANQYRKLGFKVIIQEVNRQRNLIAEKSGTTLNAPTLILSSHFDSVSNAGANDDGSGTISALTIARALAKQKFKNNLRIIAFDNEEKGLLGSRAYVKTLDKRKPIIANIQLEMMGTNSRNDGGFHVIDCKRPASVKITNLILGSAKKAHLPLVHVPGCTSRSDHSSFWNVKVPAVAISENFFGGDSDSCYHRKCDIVDARINFTYMRNITLAVYLATKDLLVVTEAN